jgi:predicted phage-related endonuclease
MNYELKELDQNTVDWLYSRVGKVTSSNFTKVMTSPRSKADKEVGNLSGTAQTFLTSILSELANCEPYEFDGKAIRHGNTYEPEARREYEFIKDVEVKEQGLQLLSDKWPDVPNGNFIGASVDGLVGADGLIEIKCPLNNSRHLRCFLENSVPDEHIAQIQGQLWITGRKWCDFISFNPFMLLDQKHLRIFIKRVPRDEKYIGELSGKVFKFTEKLIEKREFLKLPAGLGVIA